MEVAGPRFFPFPRGAGVVGRFRLRPAARICSELSGLFREEIGCADRDAEAFKHRAIRAELPPKETATAHGSSLRQLLGRSPDRADSLVLAIWALSRPRRRIPVVNRPLVYVPGSNDDRRLTTEEVQAFPEPYRGVVEFYNNRPTPGAWNDWDSWPD